MTELTKRGRGRPRKARPEGPKRPPGRPRIHDSPEVGHRQRQARYRAERKAEAGRLSAGLLDMAGRADLGTEDQQLLREAAQFLESLGTGKTNSPEP